MMPSDFQKTKQIQQHITNSNKNDPLNPCSCAFVLSSFILFSVGLLLHAESNNRSITRTRWFISMFQSTNLINYKYKTLCRLFFSSTHPPAPRLIVMRHQQVVIQQSVWASSEEGKRRCWGVPSTSADMDINWIYTRVLRLQSVSLKLSALCKNSKLQQLLHQNSSLFKYE